MSKAGIRRAFLGGNTEQGFYSYYDYILPKDVARKIFIIKGGPGAGKSTFMKKIGKVLHEKGFELEYMHCSSDSNSLDGIVMPKIKVALLDGTAPHVIEPAYPGLVDEIIDLGIFLNIEEIEAKKTDIIIKSREKSNIFARAYRYLRAAGTIYDNIYDLVSMSVKQSNLNAIANEIIDEVFMGEYKSFVMGKERKLFASAITPEGLVNHLNTLFPNGKVYGIMSEPGSGSQHVLSKIRSTAIERGYDIECFFCALKPEKIEHLIIPEKKISFTTINKYHRYNNIDKIIDLNELRNSKVYEKNREIIEYNTSLFEKLLDEGMRTIKEAKAAHGILEGYYSLNMDFDKLEDCKNTVLERILSYAEKSD